MTVGPAEASLELAANRPLLLDDGEAVWLVRNGQAVVFAVRLEDGQPAGARQYLFTAEAGEALFGVDPAAAGTAVGLLAIGAPGTHAVRRDRAWLREEALGAPADGALGLLERWIGRLSATLPDEMPPREYRPLASPGEAELESDEVAQTADGLVWVEIADGRVLLDGAEPLALGPEDGAFPLARRAWLRAVGKTRLTSLDSRGALSAHLVEAGLERFHALALKSVALRLEAAAAADAERLERQAAADQQALEQGVAGLLSAYEPRRAGDAFLAEWAEDPLLAACGLVGQALGVTIRPPARSEAGRRQVDPLGSIARASRIRMRAVTLDGDWWRHDNGPLLGYRRDDARPVALLPESGSRYVLVDPADGARAPVTAALAATLTPTAHMFYRPFPDKRLGILDLLRFGPPGRGRDLLTVLLAGLLGGLLGLATPLATGILVDRAIPAANHGQLFQLTLALLASAFGVAVFQFTRSIAFLRIEGRLDGAIQAAVWDRLLALPVPFFRGYSSGDLAMRAMSIDVIRQMLSGVVAAAGLTAFFSLFSYLLLFYYDLSLALLATVLLLVAVGVTAGTTYLQLRHLRAMSEVGGRLAGLVLELLTGLAKLRVAGAEQRAFGVWARSYGDQAALARRAQEIVIVLNVFIAAFPLVSLMAIFAVVAFQHSASLSTGTFLAFNAAFGQVTAAILALSTAITIALQVVPLYERARPIFEALPEVDLARADPGELSGEVEVSRVTFRYTPDRPPVLQDVSFRAEPGEFIALVGPSGSGKSTLLRLLLGFEAPESGSIYYDGQDLAGLDVRAVRRQIGVVLQSGKLMPGDLYLNIVGSAPLTLDDAWEAARMAGLDEDIRAMPMGMFTAVMEGAGTLSGGQRQRLLIARAIVNRPRVLLFDEATSALDNQTQAIVSRSLEGLRATRIVIAHRLSTIQRADRIYVIVAGRVVQSGSYHELIGQAGPFAELARRQLT